jgi:hypothetical protein
MNRAPPLKRRWKLARETFAERMCSHHGRSVDDFAALAWQYGAGWPTRCLRPLILCFAPRYFEAEDFHLERAADCHRRDEIAEELEYIRVSILRRGFWRYLGIGLNRERLLRHYDRLVMLQVVAADAKRVADAKNRPHPAISSREQSPS